MKKTFLFVMGILCFVMTAIAQTPTRILSPLDVGKPIPAGLEISNIANYPDSTIRLDDFKDKLVILDFWATWCGSCIQKFPELDSLQQRFGDSLQIILVNSIHTGDDTKRVEEFIRIRKKDLSLPVIIKDSVLATLFPHHIIPHYVWIAPGGMVLGTSQSSKVNAATISKVLTGNITDLHIKNSSEKLLFRSTLSSYVEGLPSSIRLIKKRANPEVVTLSCSNATILLMYKYCYPELQSAARNRIVFEVNDVTKYDPGKQNWDDWKYDHTYNYELSVPETDEENLREMMKEDLHRFFGLHFSKQSRRMKCLVIQPSHTIVFPIKKNVNPGDNLNSEGEQAKYIYNQSLDVLIKYLNNRLATPVIDQSGYTGKVFLDLPANFENPLVLRKLLSKHGLALVEKEMDLEVYVLSEEK